MRSTHRVGKRKVMTSNDDQCIHGLATGTCSLCSNYRPRVAASTSRSAGSSNSLTTPESLEQYRSRYLGDREATFDAYVEVFFRIREARTFPGGWTMFSRCANAEPALVDTEPELVRRGGGVDAHQRL